MDRYTKIAGRFLSRGLVAGMLMLALPTHAASVSFFLDQSNKLPDGTNYLSVMLTENDTGGVDFLVKTLAPLNDIAGSNFGIQKFGFSFVDGAWGEISGLPDRKYGKGNRHGGDDFGKHETQVEISGLPDRWRVQNNKQMDGFGKFDIRLAGKGKARVDTLNFTVNDVSLNDFGSLFAAQVTGFEWCKNDDKRRNWCDGKDCTTSAYFAGSMSVSQVPIPAAVWTLGSGLLGLAGVVRRSKQRVVV